MFSKKITNSSNFLMLSPSAQALYLHIGMNADDDGICELFTIMRMTESKPDDIQSLSSRGLVYVIDSKVVIVKDWNENNLIRQDRYEESRHLKDPKIKELYELIMPKQLIGNNVVNQRLPEVRLGKDNIYIAEASSAQATSPSNADKPIREAVVQKAWNWPEYLAGMETSNRRDLQIIALFWKYKDFVFENKKQAESALKRNLRPAKELTGYSNERLSDVMDWLYHKTNFKWSLETVGKYIDEDLLKLKSFK